MSDLPETTPEGYPKNNPAFDEAAKRTLEERRQDLEDADRFLKDMARELRKKAR